MTTNIDKIFYINLDKRTDRKEEIEKELNNFGLPFERFSAITHENSAVGCSYSHLEILKTARDKGYKNILILEDDFTFLIDKTEFEYYLDKLFNNFNNFNVCFLSYSCNNFEEIADHPYIKRVQDSLTSSGYIINEKYYSTLINLLEVVTPLFVETNRHWEYAIDAAWKTLQKTDMWICFDKRIGKQRPGFSDITNSYVNYEV